MNQIEIEKTLKELKTEVQQIKERIKQIEYKFFLKKRYLTIKEVRWVLIIIFFEILIPPEPFMRDAPHFFYRKYNKNLL